ncbi:MAG: phosphoribosylanthranilate isomerase [Acidimicrobiia bacterium]|nr:phosphoribosylanthranilate isomerase [Acidimicrobiia bacterium]
MIAFEELYYAEFMGVSCVQIYTMQTLEEAVALADLGVDHVGVTPANRGLPGEVDLQTAAEICAAVSGRASAVALSVESELDQIVTMVQSVRPDILHLCGPAGVVDPSAVKALRSKLPETPVMQAIAVTGPEAIQSALEYSRVADYLILDSVAPGIDGIGAAGTVHDWTVSATIVEAVDVPVILAGGLTPENVTAAIAAVGPWGVDSLTHTNRATASGGFRKDLELVRRFADAARGAGTP